MDSFRNHSKTLPERLLGLRFMEFGFRVYGGFIVRGLKVLVLSVEDRSFAILHHRSFQRPACSVAEVQGQGGTCEEFEVEVCESVTVKVTSYNPKPGKPFGPATSMTKSYIYEKNPQNNQLKPKCSKPLKTPTRNPKGP